MKKRFCDVCDGRLDNQDNVGREIEVSTCRDKKLTVTITLGQVNPNDDVCLYCAIDAVKELDDRPREGGQN